MSSQSDRPSPPRWRRPAIGLAAALSTAAVAVPIGIATANSAPPTKPASAGPSACQPSGTVPAPITQAVAQLEQRGVIDQSQEQIIDQKLASPCFSIVGLVDSGTITSAQEQQLLTALQQAKQSLAQASQAQVRHAHKNHHHTKHSRGN